LPAARAAAGVARRARADADDRARARRRVVRDPLVDAPIAVVVDAVAGLGRRRARRAARPPRRRVAGLRAEAAAVRVLVDAGAGLPAVAREARAAVRRRHALRDAAA